MSTAQAHASALIDRVSFRKAENGAKRAYLHAGKGADLTQTQLVSQALINEGYLVVPAVFEGEPALEVRGFWHENSVTTFLQSHGWMAEGAKVEHGKQEILAIGEKIRKYSLRLTSIFFMAADACYTKYGYVHARKEDMAAGVSYFLGSATIGSLGTGAQSTSEIRKQVRKLVEYANQLGVQYDANTTASVITENNNRDLPHKFIDTLQTYPGEIGNSFTALAGTLIGYSALKHRVFPKENIIGRSAESLRGQKIEGWKDTGLGVSTLFSGMIGAFVKEKKRDPDAQEKHGIKAVWQRLWERPLTVAAFGYMLSTLFHASSTYDAYRNAKRDNDKIMLKAVPWRAGFIGFTLLGEGLLAISSKGHGEGVRSDASTEDSVIAVAAQIIAQQKPEMQPALIKQFADFLGRPDVLADKDMEIAGKLQAQVKAMQVNPWTKIPAASPVHTAPELTVKEGAASWQAKVALADNAQMNAQMSM